MSRHPLDPRCPTTMGDRLPLARAAIRAAVAELERAGFDAHTIAMVLSAEVARVEEMRDRVSHPTD